MISGFLMVFCISFGVTGLSVALYYFFKIEIQNIKQNRTGKQKTNNKVKLLFIYAKK